MWPLRWRSPIKEDDSVNIVEALWPFLTSTQKRLYSNTVISDHCGKDRKRIYQLIVGQIMGEYHLLGEVVWLRSFGWDVGYDSLDEWVR